MALRNIRDARYIPLLTVNPAEMKAIETLPEKDKDAILPIFRLRPWVSAKTFQASLDRIKRSYGTRPFFAELADPEVPNVEREVHREIIALRNSENGFKAWCDFLAHPEHANFIPALQLTDIHQFDGQVDRLFALGRGLFVHVERPAFQFLQNIAVRTSLRTNGGEDVLFLLDYGRGGRDLLLQQAECVGYINSILSVTPKAYVAVSASSFPYSFVSVSSQQIYERTLYQGVKGIIGDRVIYSDRGSARAERQLGGGGTPAPRIDYALSDSWIFFRSEDAEDRPEAYEAQARLLMASSQWNPRLRLWGTQMIELASGGDRKAIPSQARAAAVRINIHLHQQLYYGDPKALIDTDEEWID